MKKWKIALCFLCMMMLCACQSAPQEKAELSLPAASPQYEAPIEDELAYTAQCPLFLPSLDGQRLLCQYATIALERDVHPAQALVQALLDYPTDSQVRALGDGVQLSLYGTQPVEVSGGVCTVNLSSSALMLSGQTLYNVCLAIATTLCEQQDIHDVNILIADQAISMDITGNLPLGAQRGHTGDELPVLWEQMEARRTPLGEDPSQMPLSATATLYFPLTGGRGVTPETRSLSFAGQTPQQLAAELMDALSAGTQYATGAADMPDLENLMLYAPQVSDMPEGGRLVSLRFVSTLEEQLAERDITLFCFLAAVVDTITTFIPSVTAVQVELGAMPLTSLTMADATQLRCTDGVIRRSAFTGCLMSPVRLYMAGNGKLIPVTRMLPAADALSPRRLLCELMTGDGTVRPALPFGLGEADVLGISLHGDTVVVNLSAAFADALRALPMPDEQLACYAIVNTICRALQVRRAVFYFDGEMQQTLGGGIYWGGEFLECPGLIDESKG